MPRIAQLLAEPELQRAADEVTKVHIIVPGVAKAFCGVPLDPTCQPIHEAEITDAAICRPCAENYRP